MKTLPLDSRIGTARADPELTLVPPAPPAERARELLRQARLVASDQLAALLASLREARELAQAVSDGGSELYGAGLPDLSRRLANELGDRLNTVQALAQRRAGILH
jgi:hypothetical protein